MIGILVSFNDKRLSGEVDSGDGIKPDFGAELFRLRLHALDEDSGFVTEEAGVVLEVQRERELSTERVTGNQKRLQHRAGGVDTRGKPGGAAADDDDVSFFYVFVVRKGLNKVVLLHNVSLRNPSLTLSMTRFLIVFTQAGEGFR